MNRVENQFYSSIVGILKQVSRSRYRVLTGRIMAVLMGLNAAADARIRALRTDRNNIVNVVLLLMMMFMLMLLLI